MYKYSFFSLLVILFSSSISSLQAQRWAGAVFAGGSNYKGDMVEMLFAVNETHLAAGGNVTYRYNEQWAIRGNFHITQLSGNDHNSNLYENRGCSFSTPIRLFSGDLMYYFNRKKPRFNKDKAFLGKTMGVTPYVFAGLGRTFMLPTIVNLAANSPDWGAKVNRYQATGKLGAGAAWHYSPRMTINLEGTVCMVNSDYVDRLSLSGQPNNIDNYGFLGLSLQYWVDELGAIQAPKHLFD